jgi:hypothetical protein
VAARDRYNRSFLAKPPAHAKSSFKAKLLYSWVRDNPVQPDGTIVEVDPDEKIHVALSSYYGIPTTERRGYDAPWAEQFLYGLLDLVDGRVVLPNWEALLDWSKGAPPPLAVTPDPEVLLRLKRETSSKKLAAKLAAKAADLMLSRHSVETQSRLGRDSVETRSTLGQDSVEPKSPETLDPDPGKTPTNTRLGLDRLGSPAIGNPKARAPDPVTPQDPHHGEHVDETTGEVIDFADERARRPESDDSDADDVDWFPEIDADDFRDVPPGEPPF